MIEVKELTKKYGNHYAIKNLSFNIEKGIVYGFLGPNGAGKSTTMNIMTGYIAASSGTVLIDGHDIVKDAEEAKKCIGYLPEMPPLYQDMTVKEYLDFVVELKKVPKAQRKEQVSYVMEKTHITDMSRRLIKNLSKGYKQRVGLAQAMLGNPDIIILDEPTVGLDPKQIIEIRELIRELKKEHTIILSSHILSEVSEVCDNIMIIAKGRLVASGTSEEILKEFGGNSTIDLLVKADEKTVKDKLSKIKAVEDITIKKSEAGRTECILHIADTKDVSEELFELLCKEKMTIIRLNPMSKSLEDIFLEVTDEKYISKIIEDEEKAEQEKKAQKKTKKNLGQEVLEEVNEKSAEDISKEAAKEAEVTDDASNEIVETVETDKEVLDYKVSEEDEKKEEE